MKNVLVTGGGGFLGSAIVRQLIDRGCKVSVAGRNRYEYIERLGATCLVGDISHRDFCDKSCRDIDTVFHVAAKAGIWGHWNEYKKINIDGTVNVVDSCRNNSVPVLVHTSTPSVVFDRDSIENGDESLGYARRYLCGYSRSKVVAERYVLENSNDKLRCCAIRPHLIWGPGDPHLVPRLIDRGRAGQLKIIGDGNNQVDITYVDNAASAHILAAENLHRSSGISGQAYFIGQEEPVRLWNWINDLYRELGIEILQKKIPLAAAYLAGWTLELLHRLPGVKSEPRMTRFLALQLARSHYFSHAKARKQLGYVPTVSIEDGKKRMIDWLTR